MAFFDRLNEMAKTVSEKTNDSLEINKLSGEINLTKGNIPSRESWASIFGRNLSQGSSLMMRQ